MSRSSHGTNRVCFDCQIKYPGLMSSGNTEVNATSVCSECNQELSIISDHVQVPKKNNNKAWKTLKQQHEQNKIPRPKSKATDSYLLTLRMKSRKERERILKEQIESINAEFGNIFKNVSLTLKKKYNSLKNNKELLYKFEFEFEEFIKKSVKKTNPDINIENITLNKEYDRFGRSNFIYFIRDYYYYKVRQR